MMYFSPKSQLPLVMRARLVASAISPRLLRCLGRRCRTLTELEHRDDGAFKRYLPGPKTGGFARGSFIAWRRHERVRDVEVVKDSIHELYQFEEAWPHMALKYGLYQICSFKAFSNGVFWGGGWRRFWTSVASTAQAYWGGCGHQNHLEIKAWRWRSFAAGSGVSEVVGSSQHGTLLRDFWGCHGYSFGHGDLEHWRHRKLMFFFVVLFMSVRSLNIQIKPPERFNLLMWCLTGSKRSNTVCINRQTKVSRFPQFRRCVQEALWLSTSRMLTMTSAQVFQRMNWNVLVCRCCRHPCRGVPKCRMSLVFPTTASYDNMCLMDVYYHRSMYRYSRWHSGKSLDDLFVYVFPKHLPNL